MSASSGPSAALLLPYAAARCLLPTSQLCSARAQRASPLLHPPAPSLPVLLDGHLEGEGSKHSLHLRWRCFWTVLETFCLPPQRSLKGQKNCQRQPTTTGRARCLHLPLFQEGEIFPRRKGRKKSSGPCDIHTNEAGGTTGYLRCRTHAKLLTLHREGCKPHY